MPPVPAARALCVLGALLCLAPGSPRAEPEEPESPDPGPGYARNGFYLSVGGVWGRPIGWDDDVESEFGKQAALQGEANAEVAAQAIIGPPPPTVQSVDPLELGLGGMGLDDGAGGFGGSVGYRLAPHAALEIEGEWVADIKTGFAIDGSGDRGVAEVSEIWTLTANLRIYPLTGRVQPFGVVGLGVNDSRVKVTGASDDLTTTANLSNNTTLEDVPAEFAVVEEGSKLDGAIRVGLGVDVYVTEQVAAEVKTDYVVPFSETEFLATDYLSVRVGVLFRF